MVRPPPHIKKALDLTPGFVEFARSEQRLGKQFVEGNLDLI